MYRGESCSTGHYKFLQGRVGLKVWLVKSPECKISIRKQSIEYCRISMLMASVMGRTAESPVVFGLSCVI